jgi:hypothetical protein
VVVVVVTTITIVLLQGRPLLQQPTLEIKSFISVNTADKHSGRFHKKTHPIICDSRICAQVLTPLLIGTLHGLTGGARVLALRIESIGLISRLLLWVSRSTLAMILTTMRASANAQLHGL